MIFGFEQLNNSSGRPKSVDKYFYLKLRVSKKKSELKYKFHVCIQQQHDKTVKAFQVNHHNIQQEKK